MYGGIQLPLWDVHWIAWVLHVLYIYLTDVLECMDFGMLELHDFY